MTAAAITVYPDHRFSPIRLTTWTATTTVELTLSTEEATRLALDLLTITATLGPTDLGGHVANTAREHVTAVRGRLDLLAQALEVDIDATPGPDTHAADGIEGPDATGIVTVRCRCGWEGQSARTHNARAILGRHLLDPKGTQ